MSEASRPSAPFQLGDWIVDPSTGQLTRGDELRRARPLVANLLLFLASRAGEVVTKDELVAGPWGGAAIADSALTSTIAELRDLLDDRSKSPRYIATLPKRGYRLIAPVGVLEPATAPEPASESIEPIGVLTTGVAAVAGAADAVAAPRVAPEAVAVIPSEGSRWRRRWTVAFALGAAFAIAAAVSIGSRRRPQTPAAPPPRPMRLTVDLPHGVKLARDTLPRLALTADGSRMAFVVATTMGPAIYTRALDQFESSPVPGTNEASAPFFSPDGSRVG